MAGDWLTQGLQSTGLLPVISWPASLQASERADSDRELFWPNQKGGITIPLEGMLFLLLPAGLLRRRREE